MKDIKKIKIQLTGTNIYFAFGNEAYNNICKKEFGMDKDFQYLGICTEFEMDMDIAYVIGVKKMNNSLSIKSTLVHELTHFAEYYFNTFGFKCDEHKAYLIQYLYDIFIPYIDKKINNVK